jgi:hypothetical protein
MTSKDVAIGSPEDLRGWAHWVEGVRGTEPVELFDECSRAMLVAADEIEALREALREIAEGAVPDRGSDPDYRTRGEMGNIASVALAFLTDEEQADGA